MRLMRKRLHVFMMCALYRVFYTSKFCLKFVSYLSVLCVDIKNDDTIKLIIQNQVQIKDSSNSQIIDINYSRILFLYMEKKKVTTFCV